MLTDNEQLDDVRRAALSGNEQFTRDKLAVAAQNPAHIPGLKRLLRDVGREFSMVIRKLIEDAIAEWETPAAEAGTKGGEAVSRIAAEDAEEPRPVGRPPARETKEGSR